MWPPESRASIPILTAAIVLCAMVFGIWPGIDLWITNRFFNGTPAFPLGESVPGNALRQTIWTLSEVTAVFALVALIASWWLARPILRLGQRVWMFAVLLFVLGPGLLVNGLLKNTWGRARPADIVEFGGTQQFTPAYQIADQCQRNCSFVSGEMTGATTLSVVLALILFAWRDRLGSAVYRLCLAVLVAVPLVVGLQRVATGRHFLSDVTFAGLFVLLLAAVLQVALFGRPKT